MKDLGKVDEIHFHVYRGKQFAFDVLWWHDLAKTQAAVITSARGAIKTMDSRSADIIVNLAPTFQGTNRVLVRLSPGQTLVLVGSRGYLELEASTATDIKTLCRGPVTIHPEVSE